MNRTTKRPWGRPGSSNPRARNGAALAASGASYSTEDRSARPELLRVNTPQGSRVVSGSVRKTRNWAHSKHHSYRPELGQNIVSARARKRHSQETYWQPLRGSTADRQKASWSNARSGEDAVSIVPQRGSFLDPAADRPVRDLGLARDLVPGHSVCVQLQHFPMEPRVSGPRSGARGGRFFGSPSCALTLSF